jgi:hypothetical protein
MFKKINHQNSSIDFIKKYWMSGALNSNKNLATHLALEAGRMEVLIHCSDPGRFGLSFFWYYGL